MRKEFRLIAASAAAASVASAAVPASAAPAEGNVQLAAVILRPLPNCAAGYANTQTHIDGKYEVYECVMTLHCANGYTAEQYEVVEEGGAVKQRYRCERLDKSQLLSAEPGSS